MSFWSDVSWQAALLKHHSFRAEDEWRLIPERGDQTITRAVQRMVTAKKGEEFSIHRDPVVPEFREGRSSLMPYVPISLRGAHGEKAPVVKIVIGPTRYPDLALSALQRYIQKLGYEAVELTRTQATYRDM